MTGAWIIAIPSNPIVCCTFFARTTGERQRKQSVRPEGISQGSISMGGAVKQNTNSCVRIPEHFLTGQRQQPSLSRISCPPEPNESAAEKPRYSKRVYPARMRMAQTLVVQRPYSTEASSVGFVSLSPVRSITTAICDDRSCDSAGRTTSLGRSGHVFSHRTSISASPDRLTFMEILTGGRRQLIEFKSEPR